MLANELRELSDAELIEKLDDFKEELFKLRFQMVTGQLDNPRRLQQVKRDIARVLTVQRHRELQAMTESVAPATTESVARATTESVARATTETGTA